MGTPAGTDAGATAWEWSVCRLQDSGPGATAASSRVTLGGNLAFPAAIPGAGVETAAASLLGAHPRDRGTGRWGQAEEKDLGNDCSPGSSRWGAGGRGEGAGGAPGGRGPSCRPSSAREAQTRPAWPRAVGPTQAWGAAQPMQHPVSGTHGAGTKHRHPVSSTHGAGTRHGHRAPCRDCSLLPRTCVRHKGPLCPRVEKQRARVPSAARGAHPQPPAPRPAAQPQAISGGQPRQLRGPCRGPGLTQTPRAAVLTGPPRTASHTLTPGDPPGLPACPSREAGLLQGRREHRVPSGVCVQVERTCPPGPHRNVGPPGAWCPDASRDSRNPELTVNTPAFYNVCT